MNSFPTASKNINNLRQVPKIENVKKMNKVVGESLFLTWKGTHQWSEIQKK